MLKPRVYYYYLSIRARNQLTGGLNNYRQMRMIDKRGRHQFMLQCSTKIEFEIVICDKLFFNIGSS